MFFDKGDSNEPEVGFPSPLLAWLKFTFSLALLGLSSSESLLHHDFTGDFNVDAFADKVGDSRLAVGDITGDALVHETSLAYLVLEFKPLRECTSDISLPDCILCLCEDDFFASEFSLSKTLLLLKIMGPSSSS